MLDRILAWIKRIFHKYEKTYSLSEYLDLVSQYTDSTIIKEKANGNYFTGGECKTKFLEDNKSIKFSIEMYFVNSQDERIKKTSERILLVSNFDDQSQEFLAEGEKSFEILSPKGE